MGHSGSRILSAMVVGEVSIGGGKMRVLLVLNETGNGLRVMVKIKEGRTKERIISLLEENRGREAFQILKSKAEVEEYLPMGVGPEARPEATLIEDML